MVTKTFKEWLYDKKNLDNYSIQILLKNAKDVKKLKNEYAMKSLRYSFHLASLVLVVLLSSCIISAIVISLISLYYIYDLTLAQFDNFTHLFLNNPFLSLYAIFMVSLICTIIAYSTLFGVFYIVNIEKKVKNLSNELEKKE